MEEGEVGRWSRGKGGGGKVEEGEVGRWSRGKGGGGGGGKVEEGEVGRWRRGRYETVPGSFPTGGASVGHI